MRKFQLFSILFAVLFLSSCALVPGGEVFLSKADQKTSQETPSITLDQIEFYKITPANAVGLSAKKRSPQRNFKLEQQIRNYSYTVGNGDVLQVTVWEHPELLNLGKEGLPAIGFLVDSQGYIFYPYIGRQHVAGKSTFAIRDQLSAALDSFIKNPQLDVTVTRYAAKKIYLTGEISNPIPIIMGSQAITLLDAINQAGGAARETGAALSQSGGVTSKADLNDVVVIRKGKRRHIDLYALMHFGDMRENILLRDGDQIHVASQKPKYAYVMGQVAAPATISIRPEGVTLAEALGAAGGLNEATADASAIYIIRKSHKKGKVAKVYMLDLSNMAAIVLASKFELFSEDVIYIAKAPIVKWNQVLSLANPTISAVDELTTIGAKFSSAINNP